MYVVKCPDYSHQKNKTICLDISIYDDADKFKHCKAMLDTGLAVALSLPNSYVQGLDYQPLGRMSFDLADGSTKDFEVIKLTLKVLDVTFLNCPCVVLGTTPSIGLPLLRYLNLSISDTEILEVDYNEKAMKSTFP